MLRPASSAARAKRFNDMAFLEDRLYRVCLPILWRAGALILDKDSIFVELVVLINLKVPLPLMVNFASAVREASSRSTAGLLA
jgi:hypothetical protein